MRSRTPWRHGGTGKDRVKEASRKLKVILKNSRKLNVTSEDLGGLKGTNSLLNRCKGEKDTENWLFYGTVGTGLLLILVVFFVVSGVLQDTLCAPRNTTREIQIQTIRLERLPLDGALDPPEDSTLYNDSEDGDEGLRAAPHLRLRRGR